MKHHLFSNEDLGIWFDHYNERCFGGKLPKVRAFFGKQVPLIGPSGRLVLGYLGLEGIVISREIQFSQCLSRGTLLHEMIHLNRNRYLWVRKMLWLRPEPKHGTGFKRNARSLMSQGFFDDLI